MKLCLSTNVSSSLYSIRKRLVFFYSLQFLSLFDAFDKNNGFKKLFWIYIILILVKLKQRVSLIIVTLFHRSLAELNMKFIVSSLWRCLQI